MMSLKEIGSEIVTVNIDFRSLPMLCRGEELKVLQRSLAESLVKRRSRLVTIEGESGSGKTTLVAAFRSYVEVEGSALWFEGKFDEGKTASEPYSAVVDCLNQALSFMLESRASTVEWQEKLDDGMKDELNILEVILPRLHKVVSSSKHHSHASPSDFEDEDSSDESSGHRSSLKRQDKWSFEYLRLAIRSFLRVLSKDQPTVIFLDDVQWAGSDSLALLRTIVQDIDVSKYLLIVCVHRPVPNGLSLVSVQGDLPTYCDHVALCNMSLSATNKLLAHLLKHERDSKEIQWLSQVVHCKTNGNIFFMLQFMQLLEHSNSFWYCTSTHRFLWEETEIKEAVLECDMVINVIAANMKLLSEPERYALMIAACFEVSRFTVDILFYAMSALDQHCTFHSTTELARALEFAVEDQFLDSLGSGEYNFKHDKIREAAYSLLPKREVQTMHLRIGRVLRKLVDELPECKRNASFRNRLLLHAVTQMNHGQELITDTTERAELISELNLQAAEVAMRKSSFHVASDFFEQAMIGLGGQAWKSHYDLMIRISSSLTRCRFYCGEFGGSVELADKIIRYAKNFQDKKVAYEIKIISLTQLGKQKASEKLCLDVLAELGVHFPRRFLQAHLIKDFLKVKRQVGRLPTAEAMKMKPCQDQRVMDALQFIIRLGEVSHSSADPDPVYRSLAILRLISLTVKHQVLQHAPMAMWAANFIFDEIGELREGDRLGKLATELTKRGHSSVRACLNYYLCNAHWQRPLMDCVEPSMRYLRDLWNEGQAEHYFMDLEWLLHLGLATGQDLRLLDRRMKREAGLLSDYNQQLFLSNYRPWFQMFSNLAGSSQHTTELTGPYMDQTPYVQDAKKSGYVKGLSGYHHCRMTLACFFGDFELCYEMSTLLPPTSYEGATCILPYRQFFCGLGFYYKYSSTRQKGFLRKGRSMKNEFVVWKEKGNPNCRPFIHILEAEELVSRNKPPRDVVFEYEEAIEAAEEGHLTHLVALAAERLGCYLLSIGKRRDGLLAIRRARESYRSWGSIAKVDQLCQEHPSMDKELSVGG